MQLADRPDVVVATPSRALTHLRAEVGFVPDQSHNIGQRERMVHLLTYWSSSSVSQLTAS